MGLVVWKHSFIYIKYCIRAIASIISTPNKTKMTLQRHHCEEPGDLTSSWWAQSSQAIFKVLICVFSTLEVGQRRGGWIEGTTQTQVEFALHANKKDEGIAFRTLTQRHFCQAGIRH